jgi:hypothetical protein
MIMTHIKVELKKFKQAKTKNNKAKKTTQGKTKRNKDNKMSKNTVGGIVFLQ